MTGEDIFYALNDIDSALLTNRPKQQIRKKKTWRLLLGVAIVLFVLNICVCCAAKFDKTL